MTIINENELNHEKLCLKYFFFLFEEEKRIKSRKKDGIL